MNIDKSYRLPFPVERVYAAWVSSKTVIPPATGMDIDPVVDGHYRLIMETPDFSARAEGVFLAVEPEKHLRYTWEWNADGEVTEIDVTFASSAEGTDLRIRHTGFVKDESVAMHRSGWDNYVEGFAASLGED